MSFSPEWLALREPVDHRSRCPVLAKRVAEHFGSLADIAVVDLGCGARSNLRAMAPLLGRRQHWTLVDHDDGLLAVARRHLLAWGRLLAETDREITVEREDGGVVRRMTIAFRSADLARDLEAAIPERARLVTAAAFFDLVSPRFIERLARIAVSRAANLYTTLTFNGAQEWRPHHPADADMLRSFCRHQGGDKGFGPAAGPDAPALLAHAFRAIGYSVEEGDSPWVLGPDDSALIADLAAGFAGAVAERSEVPPETIAAWRSEMRTRAIVGHTDTLALRS